MKPDTSWAVSLEWREAAAVSELRHRPEIEVCKVGSTCWVRGTVMDEALDRTLRSLPGANRFVVQSSGTLIPVGMRVPVGRLPGAEWVPIREWVTLEPQVAALGGILQERLALCLTRSQQVIEPTVLVTRIEPWVRYAEAAPEIRLSRLIFAAAADGRVLICGTPLPAISGTRFVERDGIATPCGFALSPQLDPSVVRDLLRLATGDLAVFSVDGSFERIIADNFVRATRSAVRATRKVVA